MNNFNSLCEFVIYSSLKSNFISNKKLLFEESKLLNFKKTLTEFDFNDILNWGFFDVFNYEINLQLELNYSLFVEAFSFFESPLKPFFAATLDGNYFLFINNSYT